MSWIRDVVQEFINYELKVKQLTDEVLRLREANKLLAAKLADEDKVEGSD